MHVDIILIILIIILILIINKQYHDAFRSKKVTKEEHKVFNLNAFKGNKILPDY